MAQTMRLQTTITSASLATSLMTVSLLSFVCCDAVKHCSVSQQSSQSVSFTFAKRIGVGFVPPTTTTTTTKSSTSSHPQQRLDHKIYPFTLYESSSISSQTHTYPKLIQTYNPTDFSSSSWPYTPESFKRIDEDDDSNFYIQPRFVTHVDEWAILSLKIFYEQQLLEQQGRGGELDILDVCSSWVSHLPNDSETFKLGKVVGVGMNAEELEANPLLTSYYIQNLNTSPFLPQFQNESFDVVLCSLSVDYLIQPQLVFQEIHRVLKPGGTCLMTFSNRYFPKKAVQVWIDAEQEEEASSARNRMGIVASYFYHSSTIHKNKGWESIESFDIQLARTRDNILGFIRKANLWKWFALAIFRGSWRIDPIYAVKAVKK